jgi:hypothetical protein
MDQPRIVERNIEVVARAQNQNMLPPISFKLHSYFLRILWWRFIMLIIREVCQSRRNVIETA